MAVSVLLTHVGLSIFGAVVTRSWVAESVEANANSVGCAEGASNTAVVVVIIATDEDFVAAVDNIDDVSILESIFKKAKRITICHVQYVANYIVNVFSMDQY